MGFLMSLENYPRPTRPHSDHGKAITVSVKYATKQSDGT